MTHVSLRLPRQKRSQHENNQLSGVRQLWRQMVRRLIRRSVGLRRRRRHKSRACKHRLDQLSDHELQDIGLTRNALLNNRPGQHPSIHYGESEYLHKGLRNLQYDLIRNLPRE